MLGTFQFTDNGKTLWVPALGGALTLAATGDFDSGRVQIERTFNAITGATDALDVSAGESYVLAEISEPGQAEVVDIRQGGFVRLVAKDIAGAAATIKGVAGIASHYAVVPQETNDEVTYVS